MKNSYQLLWVAFGAAYGLAMRIFFDHAPRVFDAKVVSLAFMIGTPFAIGALVVYGLRHAKPSTGAMICAPWLAVSFALIGSAVTLLEGPFVLPSPHLCFLPYRASAVW